MPAEIKILRPCSIVSCGKLVDEGVPYCSAHHEKYRAHLGGWWLCEEGSWKNSCYAWRTDNPKRRCGAHGGEDYQPVTIKEGA
jgi:hypothetical protein